MSSKQPAAPAPKKRRQQIAETYRMAKKGDPRIGLILVGVFVVFAALGFLVFTLLPGDGLLSTILSVVHRAVGKPGVVLIGEGNANRLKPLLAGERRKHERVIAEVPVTEIVVGRGDDQVPLPKLVRKVQKLPKKIKGPEITDTINRLKALDAQRGKVPLPKGPLPTNMKGMRQNMRGR